MKIDKYCQSNELIKKRLEIKFYAIIGFTSPATTKQSTKGSCCPIVILAFFLYSLYYLNFLGYFRSIGGISIFMQTLIFAQHYTIHTVVVRVRRVVKYLSYVAGSSSSGALDIMYSFELTLRHIFTRFVSKIILSKALPFCIIALSGPSRIQFRPAATVATSGIWVIYHLR